MQYSVKRYINISQMKPAGGKELEKKRSETQQN